MVELSSTVFHRYHCSTKHTVDKLMGSRRLLDWKNQPDPFRFYSGSMQVQLPIPEASDERDFFRLHSDFLSMLDRSDVLENAPPDIFSVSSLLYYGLAISAWKQIRGTDHKWALRVNASSGNLHPTEAHLLIGENVDGITAGAYHYRADNHSLECRNSSLGPAALWKALGHSSEPPKMIICLTSIFWRETWKYEARGFRYCQHDLGHALGCLSMSASLLSWPSQIIGLFPDKELSEFLGLGEFDNSDCDLGDGNGGSVLSDGGGSDVRGLRGDREAGRERSDGDDKIQNCDREAGRERRDGSDGVVKPNRSSRTRELYGFEERPLALMLLDSRPNFFAPYKSPSSLISKSVSCFDSALVGEFTGSPNRLSNQIQTYPIVDEVFEATSYSREQWKSVSLRLLDLDWSSLSARVEKTPGTIVPCGEAIELDYDVVKLEEAAARTIRRRRSAVDLDASTKMPRETMLAILATATAGFSADFQSRATDSKFRLVSFYLYVHRVENVAPGLYFLDLSSASPSLVPLLQGDVRETAKSVSCFQDIAADGAFAISMIANLSLASELFGDRGYRLVHYEAGFVGQLLYLATTALGYEATGIGCFLDDAINNYLALDDGYEVVYNFTVGRAVEDPRLSTLPAYERNE